MSEFNHEPKENFLPEEEVIFSVLRLSRALRRCPPDHGEHPFPPGVGRLLECIHTHSGVTSRDLCEALDLRPSSLSEILSRAESEGWITRTVDEEDRRMQHVYLSDRGEAIVRSMRDARRTDAEKKTSCFTPEEKAEFCRLCRRLCAHLEALSSDLPPCPPPPRDDFQDAPPSRRQKPFPPEGRIRC